MDIASIRLQYVTRKIDLRSAFGFIKPNSSNGSALWCKYFLVRNTRYNLLVTKTSDLFRIMFSLFSVVIFDDIDICSFNLLKNRDEEIVLLRELLEKQTVLTIMLWWMVWSSSRLGIVCFFMSQPKWRLMWFENEKVCHLGVTKCLEQIRVHYSFPGMKSKVESFY